LALAFLVFTVALAFLAFTATPASAGTAEFYANFNCPAGTAFQVMPVNDCMGQCNTLTSGASAIGIRSYGTTCTIYDSSDCTGDGQSVSIKPGMRLCCTHTQVGWIYLVRCYTGC
jgi:hypothetical protein